MDNENSGLLNKLTWLWVFFFTLDALCNALVLALTNVEWPQLSTTKQVVIVAMVLKSWAGVMISLFTKTAQRVEQGKPIIPLDTGTTQMWTKADLTTQPKPPESPQ